MRRLVFIALFLLAAGGAQGQAVRPLTVEEAIQLALENSHVVGSARQQVAEAEARLDEAKTMRLPVVAGQGSYLRLSSNVPDFAVQFPAGIIPGQDARSFTIAPAVLDRYSAVVSIQQPLFTGGRIRQGTRIAEYQAEAAVEDASATRADLALRVQEAYWTLHKAEAGLDVLNEAVAQVEAHLKDVQNLREVGMATNSDVAGVLTRRSEVRLQLVEAQNAVRMAALNLNHLIGLDLNERVRTVDSVRVRPVTESPDDLIRMALAQRPELSAFESRLQALDAGVKAAGAARYPQVHAVGNLRYANPNPYVFPPESKFTGTWDAGVSVSFDLWNWGRTRAKTGQARARLDQAEEQYLQARELIALDVERRRLEVENAAETIEAAMQAVEAAREFFRETQDRFAQGVATSAEVLDAEMALRNAGFRLSQARADHAIARAALDHAVGVRW